MYSRAYSEEEEQKMLLLLKSDSQYAFQLIYNKHKNRIYKVAMQYLKSPVLAQEVVQEVFLVLWTKREKINPELHVEGWLFKIAKNNILNKTKRIAIEWKAIDELKLIYDEADNTLQEKIKNIDYLTLINQALSSLSEMQRKVYVLAKRDDLSYLEISEILNIAPLTVKTHMQRALLQLRQRNLNWKCV